MKILEQNEDYKMYGRVPEWITATITADGKGRFYFQAPQRTDLN